MRQKEKKNNSNNSVNSLVFGMWLHTKICEGASVAFCPKVLAPNLIKVQNGTTAAFRAVVVAQM